MSRCSLSGWAISGETAHLLRASPSSYAPSDCAILSPGRSPKKVRSGLVEPRDGEVLDRRDARTRGVEPLWQSRQPDRKDECRPTTSAKASSRNPLHEWREASI